MSMIFLFYPGLPLDTPLRPIGKQLRISTPPWDARACSRSRGRVLLRSVDGAGYCVRRVTFRVKCLIVKE